MLVTFSPPLAWYFENAVLTHLVLGPVFVFGAAVIEGRQVMPSKGPLIVEMAPPCDDMSILAQAAPRSHLIC